MVIILFLQFDHFIKKRLLIYYLFTKFFNLIDANLLIIIEAIKLKLMLLIYIKEN
jgi:hypothetical protein